MKSFNYWAVGVGRSVASGTGNVTRAAVRDLRRQYLRWLMRRRKRNRGRDTVSSRCSR
jgi:hypothetical protein